MKIGDKYTYNGDDSSMDGIWTVKSFNDMTVNITKSSYEGTPSNKETCDKDSCKCKDSYRRYEYSEVRIPIKKFNEMFTKVVKQDIKAEDKYSSDDYKWTDDEIKEFIESKKKSKKCAFKRIDDSKDDIHTMNCESKTLSEVVVDAVKNAIDENLDEEFFDSIADKVFNKVYKRFERHNDGDKFSFDFRPRIRFDDDWAKSLPDGTPINKCNKHGKKFNIFDDWGLF